MKSADVRSKYLEFFRKQQHVIIPSARLVPENDASTLFTSSGMQPLVPYLLGQPHPNGKQLVNSQKCIRAQDIEEVGDNRHTTFFEMLGNWSLGSYFKEEQLTWIFTFLTGELGLEPQKLYVTVFEGNSSVPKDEESIRIWQGLFARVGITAQLGERIFTYPAKKNWWSRSGEPEHMPPGEPGGPDSEVFYDFGLPHDPKYGDVCHPNCDCGRFMEIANSVFMQYKKEADGTLTELAQKNVDFGGGLERQVAATQNNPDVFATDLFGAIIGTIEEIVGKSYGDDVYKAPMRIIADHLKAATFLIVDGVVPSNKDRGYVLRRLLRRAAIKMHALRGGLTPIPSFQEICMSVLRTYENIYFNVADDKERLNKVIDDELSRFALSLDKGLREVKKIDTIDGKKAFDLYQTYGFPVEITAELFSQKGQQIDLVQFKGEFDKHRELSRTASAGMFKGGLADHSEETTKLHTATHLLHQALHTVLGDHIAQKGSNITAERLRFDFSHGSRITPEEITQIEDLVNQQIQNDLPVSYQIMDKEEALKSGALAFFGERYADKVKVYSMGTFSKEICGGPHVERTGTLGKFKITKEESAGAGVRRMYAVLEPR